MIVKAIATLAVLIAISTLPVTAFGLDKDILEFTVPAAPWALTLPKEGIGIENQQIKPDGRYGYFSMNDNKNHMTISFFIEPADKCDSSKACRDMVWKIGNPHWQNLQNVVQSEFGNISFFEFLLPSFEGVSVNQQNVYAEFVKDGYWVDMHISKVAYKPEEHALFEHWVKAIKFEAKVRQSAE